VTISPPPSSLRKTPSFSPPSTPTLWTTGIPNCLKLCTPISPKLPGTSKEAPGFFFHFILCANGHLPYSFNHLFNFFQLHFPLSPPVRAFSVNAPSARDTRFHILCWRIFPRFASQSCFGPFTSCAAFVRRRVPRTRCPLHFPTFFFFFAPPCGGHGFALYVRSFHLSISLLMDRPFFSFNNDSLPPSSFGAVLVTGTTVLFSKRR